MIRERIADDIYVFTSKRYAQVTAGAIITKEGVVLVDTLYYPEETLAIKEFLEERLGYPVRYVINTHYHADHSQGTYLFPRAQVISHVLCRELLDTLGREGLEDAKTQQTDLADVHIVLPDMVYADGVMNLYVGGKMIALHHHPGHSLDITAVFVTNDRILFAADNAMPVPTFFDGRYTDLVQSLHAILALEPDTVVRGHGEVILRGEVQAVIDDDLAYLAAIKTAVSQILERGKSLDALDSIDIEACGKSRIPLNGLVVDLHKANLRRLYQELK
ncbi:MAG: MBL fold metallo-hydrolase [Chloroflexi bacterium]|nr:MBL fold metallo-hydrolase [Chloroflexota bacterium]